MSRIRRILTRLCQSVGAEPTAENAAKIARAIMDGAELKHGMCGKSKAKPKAKKKAKEKKRRR